MAELIHKLMVPVRDAKGRHFEAAVHGRARDDGYWAGWLEFEQVDGPETSRTDDETVQSSRANLLGWALGLEPVYVEGAFRRARAQVVQQPAQQARTGGLTRD